MTGRVGIRHLFFQELQDGDRRKIRAESNDSPTGGGARDLRISPQSAFGPFFEILLPTTEERLSNRRGTFQVRFDTIRWNWGGRTEIKRLELWPPTDARPYELRIAQIDENFPDEIPTEGGAVFLLLVRNDNGELWGHYVTEHALRGSDFDPTIARPILLCLDRVRTGDVTIRGFVDYESRRTYCHE